MLTLRHGMTRDELRDQLRRGLGERGLALIDAWLGTEEWSLVVRDRRYEFAHDRRAIVLDEYMPAGERVVEVRDDARSLGCRVPVTGLDLHTSEAAYENAIAQALGTAMDARRSRLLAELAVVDHLLTLCRPTTPPTRNDT